MKRTLGSMRRWKHPGLLGLILATAAGCGGETFIDDDPGAEVGAATTYCSTSCPAGMTCQGGVCLACPFGGRWITSPSSFNEWKFNGIPMGVANSSTVPTFGPNMRFAPDLIRASGYTAIHMVDIGSNNQLTRRWITSPTAFNAWKFDWAKVRVLPPSTVFSIPRGCDWPSHSPAGELVRNPYTGAIYYVEAKG